VPRERGDVTEGGAGEDVKGGGTGEEGGVKRLEESLKGRVLSGDCHTSWWEATVGGMTAAETS
jgi:hypothetical protein